MKYISVDGTKPTSSSRIGFWVKGSTVYDVTFSSHVAFVIAHPQRFGLNTKRIADIYKKHGEVIGSEGSAREELIKVATLRGWSRVRRYIRPRQYISIQCNDVVRKRNTIVRFLNWTIEKGIVTNTEEVQLSDFADGVTYTFAWGDDGVGKYLAENSQ